MRSIRGEAPRLTRANVLTRPTSQQIPPRDLRIDSNGDESQAPVALAPSHAPGIIGLQLRWSYS